MPKALTLRRFLDLSMPYFVGLLLISTGPMATAKVGINTCFEKLSAAVHLTPLTSGLTTKGAQILLNKLKPEFERIYLLQISRQNQNAQAYAKYLEIRNKYLSQASLARLESINANTTFDLSDSFTAAYSPTNKTITVSLPGKYQHSILTFATRAHEMEHARQDMIDGLSDPSPLNPFAATLIFNLEKQAMLAEGIFLLAIPRAILKEELATMLNEESQQHSDFSKMAVSLLTRARGVETAYEYVNTQWTEDRYSPAAVFKIQWRDLCKLFRELRNEFNSKWL